MSISGSDFFDTENKKKVRKELWGPCFDDLEPKIKSRKQNIRNFRYLCFPGIKCIFVDDLLKENRIDDNCFIVGVEKDKRKEPKIKDYFGNNFKYKNNFIYAGKIQELIEENDFCNKFPFDIINFDNNGSLFSLATDEGDFVYLNAIQSIFQLQAANFEVKPYKMKQFYFINTSNTGGYLPPKYNTRYNGDMAKFVINEIINEYIDDLDIPELRSLVNKKNLSNKDRAHISIIGVNLKIINYGSQNFNIELRQVPYYYQGHKEGAKMVSMVYESRKIGTRVRTNGDYTQKRTQNLKNAVLKALETNFISEP